MEELFTKMDKLSKRQKANEGEDIISNLPEVIIGHILSFLPIEAAIRTSVLSKRWIYMWTFITKISFSDFSLTFLKDRKLRKYFTEFVYRVLLHLDNSSIQSFSLSLNQKYAPSIVNAWVSTILNRRVQKLYVNLGQQIALSFHSLFKCKFIVDLQLNMYGCAVRVPKSVCLPHLTILRLSGIAFNCNSSSNSGEVILNFPVLKEFGTKNCTWLGVKVVTLDVPVLEVLLVVQNTALLVPNESHNCVIKVRALHLTEFTYGGDIIPHIILIDPSTAQNATANIFLHDYEDESMKDIGIRVCKLMKQFNQVKCLTFSTTEVLVQAKDYFLGLPAFGMLSHLKLKLVTVEILLGFLLKSPFLKSLIVQNICEFDTELLNSAIVPHCLVSTVQEFKFGLFHGYEYEFCLAKFVMENAVALKNMNISIWGTLDQSNMDIEEVKGKLLSCKKGSSSAIIEFSSV